METVNKLEIMIAGWFKDLPHLPVAFHKWLATNVWWIAIIGAVLSATALLFILFVLALLTIGLSIGGSALAGVLGGVVGATVGGIISIAVIVSVTLLVAEMVLLGMSVSPLKAMAKHGWSLLFIILLLNVVANVVTNILVLNIFALLVGLFWAGVGGYFLFEIREYFGMHHKAVHQTAVSSVNPAVTSSKV
ncbi:hypothetical protein EON76_03210 [bacterium]|nr:MAG: hypothetical protein EON76_03210 [bacterium]